MQEDKKPWKLLVYAGTFLGIIFGGSGGSYIVWQIQRSHDIHDARVKENLPLKALQPRPTDDGKAGFPIRNPSSKKHQVHAAIFALLPEPVGAEASVEAAALPYIIRFEPGHYNPIEKRYEKLIDTLFINEGDVSMPVVEVVMAGNSRQIYGRLTLLYGDKQDTPLKFSPTWVKTIKEAAAIADDSQKAAARTDSQNTQPTNNPVSPSLPRRRMGRR